MAQLKGTVKGTYGSEVDYYLDYTLNSQDKDNNKSNVTLHMYAKQRVSRSQSAFNLNGTAVSKIAYQDSSGLYTYVVDRKQNMDFRNSKMVEMGSWTGNIAHNKDGDLTLDLLGEFNTNGPSSITTGNVSGKWPLPHIEVGSVKVKVNGAYKNGTPYVKVNGAWKKGIAYVKVGGAWRKGIL